MKRPWFAVVSALLLMLLATACTIRDSKTVCDDKDLCIKVKFICQGEERTSVDIQVNLRKESKATKPIPVKFVVEDENDAFIKDEKISVLAEPEGKVPSSGSASGFRLVAHDTATYTIYITTSRDNPATELAVVELGPDDSCKDESDELL